MKALVYVGEHRLREMEVESPVAANGEVLVTVLQAGVCGTDMCVVQYERPKAPDGMTLGHELVGLRQDTGERVVVNSLVACGVCRACTEGRPHLCAKREVIGVHRNGGFAETVRVPERNLVPAGNTTAAQAAMADPIATALHAFRLSGPIGGPVAVLGAGGIGLSMLFVLKRFGIADITVTDLSDDRLALARRAGADAVAKSAEGVYDVVFDTVGLAGTRREAAARVRAGGVAVFIGLHGETIELPAGPIIGGERTIKGSMGFTPDEFREAVTMLPDLDTSWIQCVPFAEAEGMFTALLEGKLNPGQVKLQMRMTG